MASINFASLGLYVYLKTTSHIQVHFTIGYVLFFCACSYDCLILNYHCAYKYFDVLRLCAKKRKDFDNLKKKRKNMEIIEFIPKILQENVKLENKIDKIPKTNPNDILNDLFSNQHNFYFINHINLLLKNS